MTEGASQCRPNLPTTIASPRIATHTAPHCSFFTHCSMSDSQIESEKALNLARKYDEQGDLSNAIKWCNKSIAIESTPAAKALLSRLQTKGVNGASSSSSGSSGGVKTNGSATKERPSAAAAAAAAAAPEKQKERAYTSEQLAVVKRIRSAGGDFYKVLSVEKTVDENGIKKAYRKVCTSVIGAME